ncbi:MAG: hypothetical protein EBR40_11235 [Proteobacteria bacterium]|nr:hypothetical protein [Pseudomonadota bacterium]
MLAGSGTWAGVTIGDLVNVYGCRDAVDGTTSIGVDGAWKVANLATSTLTLVLPFSGSQVLPADFATTNCGGGVIRRTDLRLSYVRIFDYDRQRVELTSRPGTDILGSVPTQVTNTPAVTISSGTVTTVSTVTTVTTVSTVTAVTTVGTVTNQSQMGGVNANQQIPALMQFAADSLRRNIAVT